MRDVETNQAVRQRLDDRLTIGARPTVMIHSTLHDKGLVGDRFHVHGSMNFTYFGQAVNDEGVSVTSDPQEISQARIAYNAKYNVDR
jgi:hypothetical protein